MIVPGASSYLAVNTNNMLPSVKLIVFDVAGTTLADHQEVHHCLQKALARADVSISYEEANRVMGYPKPRAIRLLLQGHWEDHSVITSERIEVIHDDFVLSMVEHYQNAPDVRPKEGVLETWQALRSAGVIIALDTGFSRPIADAIIERLHWQDYINTSVTSDEVKQGRPHPDMIFTAMERTGVGDVSEVAKVGDTASDMQQGTAAGCGWVVGVTTGAYSAADLEKEPHTHLIEQLPELLPILGLSV
ncbi:HAD hydrolase-like protein [Tunicatimonas pelagia]|uniref:HAD hydrolase-like protein n=1 Tax=Tunicatimonas pelagia TaxID=931531 RepID=UPI002665225D|nr:HAD hydrolase-like protein [Tunicatimonas pelagia]WKN43410.1 HAD hydrolase-like protein [Tunicatimonas pelagia]